LKLVYSCSQNRKLTKMVF